MGWIWDGGVILGVLVWVLGGDGANLRYGGELGGYGLWGSFWGVMGWVWGRFGIWGPFGGVMGQVWDPGGPFGVGLGWIWVSGGPFGGILGQF